MAHKHRGPMTKKEMAKMPHYDSKGDKRGGTKRHGGQRKD